MDRHEKSDVNNPSEIIKTTIQIICSIIGAIIGILAAFFVAGEIWGWFWIFFFTPLGAVIGRFCGWLFTRSGRYFERIFWKS